MPDCIFCRIIQKEIPAAVVYEDEDILAFNDISPQAPVHVLIIPKKHIPTLFDLEPEDEAVLGRIQVVAARLARELGLAESGYRIVANCLEGAGQAVFHIHYHLIGGRKMAWPPG